MKGLYILIISVLFVSCGIRSSLQDRPDISGISLIDTVRTVHNSDFYSLGNNQLFKNEHGVWELYLEGNALERGLANGSLSRELIRSQESAFMEKLEKMVPSENYRGFLKQSIKWFNRKMYLHVPEEFKQEIYGVSRFGSEQYNEFAPAYLRMLYLHGAHDIGHALQDLMLVGCTSFAAWDSLTADGELLVGRNFDFYAGDEFGKQKIAAFINPDEGYKFMMYTWGGMIGVVSGMNIKGISVTINAAKSGIPLVAKTPISLVAREILQYASNIQQAIAIAKKREVFVAESIMVTSGDEKKAVLIEVSPNNFGVYNVAKNNKLICSNHFQSKEYLNDRRNIKSIEESHSRYRYMRMDQLLSEETALDEDKAVDILRNRDGLDEEKLGLGNELAINQLLAHHGIVFKPKSRQVWVSANPYQMGEFIAFDLEEVFKKYKLDGVIEESVSNPEQLIASSDFIKTQKFQNYETYRKLEANIRESLKNDQQINSSDAERLTSLNPHFWEAYYLAGRVNYRNGDFKRAVVMFKQARKRKVTTKQDMELLNKMIRKSYRKL